MEKDLGADQEAISPDESEEELLPSTTQSFANSRKTQSSKKHKRNRCTRNPSPTSSEASIDTEKPRGRSSKRGTADSSTLSLPTNSRMAHADSESDDSLPDVSPRCSPDSNPLQFSNPNFSRDRRRSIKDQQRKSDLHQDEDLSHEVDKCSLNSESPPGGIMVYSGGRNRANYSFRNDEVRVIEQENDRLLRELSRIHAGSRQGNTMGQKTQASNTQRLSHSAINRQREQRRIKRDNLVLLKKLESAKPTRGIRRSEQLADYQRHLVLKAICGQSVCPPQRQGAVRARRPPEVPDVAVLPATTSREVSSTNDIQQDIQV